MKKLFALLLIAASLFSLFACSGGEDLPEGMQLVYGGEDAGYYFYAPEEWLISNVGDIKSAYISRVNTTSVSFAEVKLEGEKNNGEYFFTSYFDDNKDELSKMKNFTVKENGKDFVFGAKDHTAQKAKQYIYTYEYPSYRYESGKEEPTAIYYEFCFMQILMMYEGRFYIFTYSAQNTAEEGVTPNYAKYLEKVTGIIENFRFVKKIDKPSEEANYERDADGYLLISDKSLAGFDFYVPENFKPDYASAIVSASHEDGSNVNITEATATGVYASDYWKMRKHDLSVFASDIQEIKVDEPTRLGNNSSMLYGDWAYAYEYTYNYSGTKYHVYQIIAINGSKGYVFTYTATDENYSKHIGEIERIIEKVNF